MGIESGTIIERTTMVHKRYAFHAIAPSHGSWGLNTLLLAGGKDDEGYVLSDVDAIHCGYIMPTSSPTSSPTMEPTMPTSEPTTYPTSEPSQPTSEPTIEPTGA